MGSAGREKIAVGMSGGMDSSVAAAILVEDGCDAVGLTAHMWKDGSRCCSLEDVARARRVAWHLGIPHYVPNATRAFARCVVAPFVREYAHGRTPSPCVRCNESVKFGFLLTRAVQMGAVALATGHYARTAQRDGSWRLLKARDGRRDQSYFLHRLSQRQLAHARFPLGDMVKDPEVRRYARDRALPCNAREESRDLCFVPVGRYAEFVEREIPAAATPGPILDSAGNRLGSHSGLHRYTVGQRRGLGIAASEPLYVTRLDPQRNALEVGPYEQALRHTCRLEEMHWVSGQPPALPRQCAVRVRYQHEEAAALIMPEAGEAVRVEFATPQFAVSPGQAGVLYDGDEVLGGGWIGSDTDRRTASP